MSTTLNTSIETVSQTIGGAKGRTVQKQQSSIFITKEKPFWHRLVLKLKVKKVMKYSVRRWKTHQRLKSQISSITKNQWEWRHQRKWNVLTQRLVTLTELLYYSFNIGRISNRRRYFDGIFASLPEAIPIKFFPNHFIRRESSERNSIYGFGVKTLFFQHLTFSPIEKKLLSHITPW